MRGFDNDGLSRYIMPCSTERMHRLDLKRVHFRIYGVTIEEDCTFRIGRNLMMNAKDDHFKAGNRLRNDANLEELLCQT